MAIMTTTTTSRRDDDRNDGAAWPLAAILLASPHFTSHCLTMSHTAPSGRHALVVTRHTAAPPRFAVPSSRHVPALFTAPPLHRTTTHSGMYPRRSPGPRPDGIATPTPQRYTAVPARDHAAALHRRETGMATPCRRDHHPPAADQTCRHHSALPIGSQPSRSMDLYFMPNDWSMNTYKNSHCGITH